MNERWGWVLPAAGALAAVETLALIVVLALSGAPLAPYVIGALVVKLPFCWLVVQKRPGALLGLLLWEIGGMLAALRAEGHVELRFFEATLAAVVFCLLLAAVPLFPSVKLPEK
ncbi:MAG: hypothetical protein QOJ09_1211 [Actinomycetota bacterium]|nr:hypothetical protein [Actinomycetota bacterium]